MEKQRIILALFMLLAGSIAYGQVPFRKLQSFLPDGQIEGFLRQQPAGQTAKFMGFASSTASVRYEEEEAERTKGSPPRGIEIIITDAVNVPAGMWLGSLVRSGFSYESTEGYAKSTEIEGFPAVERVQSRLNRKSCEILVGIADRFYVELKGMQTDDIDLLYDVVADMRLDALAKLGSAR